MTRKHVVVFLGLLLIPSPKGNIIYIYLYLSAEGVLVSPRVMCFYPTPSTIYENNGKFCFWGVKKTHDKKMQIQTQIDSEA